MELSAGLLIDQCFADFGSEEGGVERLVVEIDDLFSTGLGLAAREGGEDADEENFLHFGAGNERQRSLPPAFFPPRRGL